MNIELVTATATAPGAGGAAAAAVSGDSLVVKNNVGAKQPRILALWSFLQGTGFVQLATPSGHDTTRGYRASAANAIELLNTLGLGITVSSQETMAVTIAGSAVAGDVEQVQMLIHYPDVPGLTTRTISYEHLRSRATELTTIDQSIIGTAGPGYSGSVALSAVTADLLRANSDYAVLGALFRTQSLGGCSLNIRGPDTSNVRLGIPMILRGDLTAQWFPLLSRAYDLPLIPVINSGNKASTFLDLSCNENGAAQTASLVLALLK